MLRLTTLLVFLLPLSSLAQNAPARHATVLDLTGAAGPSLNSAAVAGWRLWGLDPDGRFQVGLGVRGTYFFAKEADYDRQAGEGGLSLRMARTQLAALNAALHLRARVAGPVRLGFNIDLAGFTLGPAQTAYVPADNGQLFAAAVEPVRGNILLGGTRDRGTLNSELYASLALPSRLSLRVGYDHIVTAYELKDQPGARYRRFRNLASLGLSYEF